MSFSSETPDQNYLYHPDFKLYNHGNPYHQRLKGFDSFVITDEEAEKNLGLWQKVFNTHFPVHLEIGSGHGDFMMDYCQKNPSINFIGLDHQFKRSFSVAKKLDQIENKNFKFLRAKAERIEFMFAPQEVSRIYYFFPDPWPKNRHNKKRLFQQPFLNAAHRILNTEGEILIKTDHDGYFEWMLNHLKLDPRFKIDFLTLNLHAEFPEHFLASFQTKFEKIFISKGVQIKALVIKKINSRIFP